MIIKEDTPDINSVENLLFYMDEFPHSGQNKAAAKLIRELMTSSAPLVAVTGKPTDPYNYRAILENVSQCYTNGVLKPHHMAEVREILAFKNTVIGQASTLSDTNVGDIKPAVDNELPDYETLAKEWHTAAMVLARQIGISPSIEKPEEMVYAAGQVAPKATTDIEDACRSAWASFESDNGSDDLRYPGFRSIWLSGRTFGVEEDMEPQATVEPLTDEQITNGLKLHHLAHDKPSQLADAFRAGAKWGLICATPPTSKDIRKQIDQLESDIEQALRERDSYHDTADNLAEAIADHFGWDIGEHSSGNNPWFRALESINELPYPTSKATERRELIPAGSDLEDQLQTILVRVVDAAIIPDHGSRSRALYEELRGWINDIGSVSTSKADTGKVMGQYGDVTGTFADKTGRYSLPKQSDPACVLLSRWLSFGIASDATDPIKLARYLISDTEAFLAPTQCTHPSWKAVENGKHECEICGALGRELRYLSVDAVTPSTIKHGVVAQSPIKADLPEPVEAGTGVWQVVAPDGNTWFGDTALKALSACRKDTVDPVVAMKNLLVALDGPAFFCKLCECESDSIDLCKGDWLNCALQPVTPSTIKEEPTGEQL